MMRIDVWSDVACPWCYVGKRNLEAALRATGIDAELHWRAFELDPGAPKAVDRSLEEVLASKYQMSVERATELNVEMTETARQAGLEYHLDKVRLANSFDAHRLAKLAEARGLGGAATERLFAAYFSEGRLISDPETLVELGTDIGLDAEEVRALLDGPAFAAEVRADEEAAREAGFTGVPTFVVDGRIAIPGAQSPETMERLLSRLAEESA
jgi:predicted DsbA family dithiol-disulfide isomerase